MVLHSLPDLREQLASDLARAFLSTVGDRISQGEAAMAARSVISGEPLPQSFIARLGKDPVCSFVSFDADRIQSWVFASERVQVAKGASQTLEYLNLHVDKMVREIEGLHGVIYSAGGGGMLFASGTAEPEALASKVRGWLERASHELTFTVLAQKLYCRDLQPSASPKPVGQGGLAALDRFELVDGLRGILARLQVRLREAKEASPRYGGSPIRWEIRPGTASERCPSCGRRPRGAAPPGEDGPKSWCGWCKTLRDAALHNARSLEEPFFRNGRWLTFSDLAEASNRRRKYLGFVAIDGNGMGSVVQGIRSLLQLRAFSAETTRIYETARDQIETVLAQGFLAPGWNPEEASLSLLSGGDEVTFVLPAAAAPAAAVAVLRSIEQGFDRSCQAGGLLHAAFESDPVQLERLRTAGAAGGIVVAQSHYPVRLLRHYADRLQKQAKQAGAAATGRSEVAWTLLTDSSPLPEGPSAGMDDDFRLEGFETLLGEARAAQRAGVPNAALHRLVGQAREEDAGLRSIPPARIGRRF